VAFAILALALGVLFQIFSLGMRSTVLSEAYSRAVLLAQSKLATVGVEEALAEGATAGEIDDAYRWQVSVQPWAVEESKDTAVEDTTVLPRRFDPVQVTVDVLWDEAGHEHSVSLSTLRLVGRRP